MLAIEQLDNRLYTIATQIRPNSRLADVGCDHGLLITALAQDGLISTGIACDVNPLPLEKARRRIADLHLYEQLDCRLSDGLSGIACDEVDDIVLAGMGGELIAKLIGDCPWRHSPEKRWILEPMTKLPFLRGWLLEQGFAIEAEQGCHAAGKYYSVLRACYSGQKIKLSALDPYLYFGELPNSPTAASKGVLRNTARALKKRGTGLNSIHDPIACVLLDLAKKLETAADG